MFCFSDKNLLKLVKPKNIVKFVLNFCASEDKLISTRFINILDKGTRDVYFLEKKNH